MSPEKVAEFNRLARFLGAFWTLTLGKKASESGIEHPTNSLKSLVESVGMSKAMTGLKQAVNDCLAMAIDFAPDAVRKMDEMLAKGNAPTLSEMRREYWSKVNTIRKRGQIRNDTEFYLLKDLADDDRELLEMVESYEAGKA